MSDYGHLASTKYCIPEEDRESENMDYTSQKDYNSNGSYIESDRPENGHVCTQTESRKRRPISVNGADLFSSPTAEQKDDTESLPSVRPIALFLSSIFCFVVQFLHNFCDIKLSYKKMFQNRLPKHFSPSFIIWTYYCPASLVKSPVQKKKKNLIG